MRRRAARVDMAQRQAARRQVRHLRRQRLDAGAQVQRRQLVRRRRAVGGVDHQRVQAHRAEHGGQPLEHHAGEGHVRVGDHGDEARPRAGEQPAQAMRLVGGRGRPRNVECRACAVGVLSVGVRRAAAAATGVRAQAGEDQVHVAGVHAPGAWPARCAAPAAPAHAPTGGASPRARAGRWRRPAP